MTHFLQFFWLGMAFFWIFLGYKTGNDVHLTNSLVCLVMLQLISYRFWRQ